MKAGTRISLAVVTVAPAATAFPLSLAVVYQKHGSGGKERGCLDILWSFLTVLDRFNNHELTPLVATIQSLRLQYGVTRGDIGGGKSMDSVNRRTVLNVMERAAEMFEKIGLVRSAGRAKYAAQQITGSTSLDYSTACSELQGLEFCVFGELSEFRFLQIRVDRQMFFPSHEDPISNKTYYRFSADIDSAFPSARDDINEAGYCLAVEANTAAVYHLICAAEHGLRALAKDRRIAFPKGPIELQQWGDIIRELEKAVAAINNWPKSMARESALEFYNKAVKECRYFNEAYRRHVAHARRHYDRHEALSAMEHGRDFMKLLASKITEKKRTPLVWKKA